MNSTLKLLGSASLAWMVLLANAYAQTEGTARLAVTIKDYTGTSNMRHWTVVWVTTASGTFIKTLRKQGPTITASHWNSHCAVWYSAKNGSTALDGYSSSTAQDYSGTNSPVILTWDGRDANGAVMPDGDYKFWVQYAEDSGQGPYTTSGLLWTKGAVAKSTTYPDQSVNFASMRVDWTPAAVAPPEIDFVQLEGNTLVLSGTGPANAPYRILASTDVTLPAANWNGVATNSFGADGSFAVTNTLSTVSEKQFYRVISP